MIEKVLILGLALVGSLARYSSGQLQNQNKMAQAPEKGIVFGASYQAQKRKWDGPLHRRLLFPWLCTSTAAENQEQYQELLTTQRKNGVKYVGYYYSSTTSYSSSSLPTYRQFPELAIPPVFIKPSWILRDDKGQPVRWPGEMERYYLDVGRVEVQNAILNRAIRNAKRLGPDMLFLDNWYYKYWSPTDMRKEQWTEKCLSFLLRARELTHQSGLKLIVNTASPPKHWIEFAPHLDGVAYEMGAHPYRLRKQDRYEEELSSYEKVMAMGKSIFLYTDILKDKGGRWDLDGRKVAATAMLVMPKSQPDWGGIYVSPPRYEVWPVGGWPMWPEQLGKPLGPRQWQHNTVSRKFERGSISVTVGENPVFKVAFEY